MSIAGIGFDLVEVKRFSGSKIALLERLFNEDEIEYANKHSKPELHFSACFAVKEAFLKAMGTGLSGGIKWKDIELHHKNSGQPFISFRGKNISALVTISHTETTAGAFVILTEVLSI